MPRQSGKRQSAQRRSAAPRRDVSAHPPQLSSNVRVSHTYRFTSTSGNPTAISTADLLGAAGVIAATTTTAYSVFDSVKVTKVSIWAPPASQGTASTCSVEWVGPTTLSTSVSNFEISDTSNSVSRPAHVSGSPPKQSLASFWNQSSTAGVFTLVAPTGSIVDVSLMLIFSDDEFSASSISLTGPASVGAVYYLALDGPGANTFKPVSLTTIH